MINKQSKNIVRLRIHERIRKGLKGTAARPRLAVFRSVKHIYAQVIDDVAGKTLVSASSNEKSGTVAAGGNVAGAKAIGKLVGEGAQEKGVKKSVFERGREFLQFAK